MYRWRSRWPCRRSSAAAGAAASPTTAEAISQLYGGELDPAPQSNNVYVTIGLFTIVQIVRSVPMTVPASEFCVPEKECVPTSHNPCELFRRIDFPVGEFFPPRAGDCDCGCSADRAR